MIKTYSFENLTAWKEARVLVNLVYQIANTFPKEELFGMTAQIKRAALSITNNIAEGSSRLTKADQKHFYKISFSSTMEVLNIAIAAHDQNYINEEKLIQIREQIDKTAYLIACLRKS